MNVVIRPTISGISLCAGVAMLDEGVKAAFDYLGFEYRTICYVERDSYAAATLVARMEDEALDQALIWDDLTTFPGRSFRGKVDCIVAGFPCQDISLAGKRKGLDGERSGLFFNILDIAADCDARFMLLENVAGIASASASVLHETEELEERAAARVVGELADRRWNAEWLHLRASGIGASHQRERWFCFAWRAVANPESERGRQRQRDELSRRVEAERASDAVGNTRGINEQAGRPVRLPEAEPARRHGLAHTVETLGHADELRRRPQGNGCLKDRLDSTSEPMANTSRLPSEQRTGRKRVQQGDQELELTESERFNQGWPEHARLEGRHSASEHGRALGEPNSANCEGGGV